MPLITPYLNIQRSLFVVMAVIIGCLAILPGTSTAPVYAASEDTNTDQRGGDVALSQPERTIYVVSIFKFSDGTDRDDFKQYLDEISPLLATSGGGFSILPIHIQSNLQNPALPSTTANLNADIITIVEFPNINAFQAFANTAAVIAVQSDWSARLDEEIRFLGVTPPEFAVFPALGSVPFHEPPAFLLVNAIQINPTGFDSFNQYSAQAVPLAMSTGTQFFAPIAPLHVLKGEFDYTFLALTEWTSPGVFHQFHHSADFLEIVPLRNNAVTQFIEASGHLIR